MAKSLTDAMVGELQVTLEFFNRSTSVLTEDDAQFRPTPDSLSVVQQVAHVGQTVDWFRNAITSPEGFDLDFEAHWREISTCKTLKDARAWVEQAFAAMKELIGGMDEAALHAPFPPGPVLGGAPKLAAVGSIVDHTAHHRGALTVYCRLLGKQAPMPYMDM